MNAVRSQLLSHFLSKCRYAGQIVQNSVLKQTASRINVSTSFISVKRFHRHTSFAVMPLSSRQSEILKCYPLLPFGVSNIARLQGSHFSTEGNSKKVKNENSVVSQDEDPFDTITDRIPERPVTVAEASSYSVVILAGLAVAFFAVYAVLKELLLEPKEYQVFNKALDRVKIDSQIVARLGSPITGYGQESRNRAARQRIANQVWKDEDGIERIQVQFHIRGPHGAGLVHCEMFKDKDDRGKLKFTYLLVDITSPRPARIMLESYVPEVSLGTTA